QLIWHSPTTTLLKKTVDREISKDLNIRTFISMGRNNTYKKAEIILTTKSPSLIPTSVYEFNSLLSRGATIPGIPKVAIIEAATR
ncbi:hypothetical protein, partial [Listeria monocytogenes]|uniref:hypothetical protein n=1 Tax=Listeria monocytogenes TaxID=1639 RepID=UPI000D94B579